MRTGRALVVAALTATAIVVGAQPMSDARAPRATIPALTTIADAAAPFDATLDEGMLTSEVTAPDVRAMNFRSDALGRAMPYSIYLPPGYDMSTRHYPVLYMLHGMSGTNDEWRGYGIFDTADRMIRAREMRPLIIVLPQGDKAYWVDHALPTDKEAWGRYMAKDVVANVDARFRTLSDSQHRAIGGVSMGAHGAMQLAMNYPDIFSVVGAHSLVLRRYDTAPAYFGSQADWAKRDPMQLVTAKVDLMNHLDVWIDIGSADPWAKLAEQFNSELTTLKIDHQWHEWSGDHSASYWESHLEDYLRFYDGALRMHLGAMPADSIRLL